MTVFWWAFWLVLGALLDALARLLVEEVVKPRLQRWRESRAAKPEPVSPHPMPPPYWVYHLGDRYICEATALKLLVRVAMGRAANWLTGHGWRS